MPNTQETADRPGEGEGPRDNGLIPLGQLPFSEEQSQAEQTLFNDKFVFAEFENYNAHMIEGETDGFPAIYIRLIFDDEAQRQDFLKNGPFVEVHPFEVDL